MGLTGPIRDPNSRRGLREGLGAAIGADTADPITPPSWLLPKAKRIFKQLCADMAGARVPVKFLDAHAVGMAAQTLAMQDQVENNPALFARVGRDAMQWLEAIGATPRSRARMGIRGNPDAVKETQLSNLLNRKTG